MADTKASIADEQFPGTHTDSCDCWRCRLKRKKERQQKKEQARILKREARKRGVATFFAGFGEKASRWWGVVSGCANAALSTYTVIAIVAIVAVMVRALWLALETGGDQWIVALCCVPGLVVVVWLNERLGV